MLNQKKSFDYSEHLLIDMHLPCDSEESLEVKRNEEKSYPIGTVKMIKTKSIL